MITTLMAFMGGIAYEQLYGAYTWDAEPWHVWAMLLFALLGGGLLEALSQNTHSDIISTRKGR